MPSPEPSTNVPKSLTNDAPLTAPRIVNGLTMHPRKKVNVWLFALPLLPDFVALLVFAGLGLRRMLGYLDVRLK